MKITGEQTLILGKINGYDGETLIVDGESFKVSENVAMRLQKINQLTGYILLAIENDQVTKFSFKGMTMVSAGNKETKEKNYQGFIIGYACNPKKFIDKKGKYNVSFSIPVEVNHKNDEGGYDTETIWTNCIVWYDSGLVEDALALEVPEGARKRKVAVKVQYSKNSQGYVSYIVHELAFLDEPEL